MREPKAPRVSVITIIVVVIAIAYAVFAVQFPLLGTPGFEIATVLGAGLAPFLFADGAARGALRLERGFVGDLLVTLVVAAVAAGIVILTTVVNGLTVDTCQPGRGLLPFAILTAPVLWLMSAAGVWVGRLVGHRRGALITSVLVLGAYVAWMYVSEGDDGDFFVLSHVIAIPGDLWAAQSLTGPLAGLRLSTALFAAALTILGAQVHPKSRRHGRVQRAAGLPWPAIFAILCVVVGAMSQRVSTQTIAPGRDALNEAYTLKLTHGGIELRADPAAIDARQAKAMLAEAVFWMNRLQTRLAPTDETPITVWLHADDAARAHWTGAKRVDFALPWKRELHIAGVGIPHNTLGHELAHVVAGEFNASKLMPAVNAGLVEGLAMAVTPELAVRQDLTLMQQAAAMRRAGRGVDPRALFEPGGFWRRPPARAYVMSGALLRYLMLSKAGASADQSAQAAAAVLQDVYRASSLDAAFGSADAKEKFMQAFEAHLDALELPPYAVAVASRRFAKPSILDATCDVAAEEAARDVLTAARGGDFKRAEKTAREHETTLSSATLLRLGEEAVRQEQFDVADGFFTRVAGATSADEVDARTRGERLNDMAAWSWFRGDRRGAIALWGRVQTDALPPGLARLVRARLMLAERAVGSPGANGELANAALAFLLSDVPRADARLRLAALAETEARLRHRRGMDTGLQALARYLLARQAVQRGDVDGGLLGMLAVYRSMDKLDEMFHPEVLRGIALAHARRGDAAIGAAGFEALKTMDSSAAVRVRNTDFAERLTAAHAAAFPGARWLTGLSRGGAL